MTDSDRTEKVTIRLTPEELAEIDEQAEAAGVSRSELIRKQREFAQAVSASHGQSVAEVEADVEQQIEQNQTLRRVLPSKWESHVTRLMTDDIRDDLAAEELALLAEGYREQARKYETLAEMHPLAPDADLVGIVDDVLVEALEGADLTDYYQGVENRFEKKLEGVESGAENRRQTVSVVQGVMQTSLRLAEGNDRVDYISPDVDDLPDLVDLPDAVDRADVVSLASELLAEGYTPEDAPDAIDQYDERMPGADCPPEQRADTGPRFDTHSESKTVEVPSEVVDGDPNDVDGHEQEQLVSELPAADGGRDPDSVPGSGSEDTNMNPINDSDDSSTDVEPNADRAPAEGADDE